jgi:hypothetical protein
MLDRRGLASLIESQERECLATFNPYGHAFAGVNGPENVRNPFTALQLGGWTPGTRAAGRARDEPSPVARALSW